MSCSCWVLSDTLQQRYNGHNGIPNHQLHDCLLNRLFRRRSKPPSKLRITGLCGGNSLVTSEFPAQMASNMENVSIWWHHHVTKKKSKTLGALAIQDNHLKLILNSNLAKSHLFIIYHLIVNLICNFDQSTTEILLWSVQNFKTIWQFF